MLQFKKADKSIKEQAAKERQQAYDNAVGAAQNCLRNEDFKRYKAEYERLTELLLAELAMIDDVETDPVKYGFQCKDIVSKWRHIGALLQGVNRDAGKI